MYTFVKANLELFYEEYYRQEDMGCRSPIEGVLCRICGEERNGCEEVECAEYLGRIWALFGKPDDPSAYEEFYSYIIAAKDGKGSELYLQISQHCNLPTIYGPIPEGMDAAQELAELIRRTAPVDYEWKGAYADYDVEMTYSVKNGIAAAEDKPLGIWDAETDLLNTIIDRVFEVMSPEDAAAWANQYRTEEAMLAYWQAHPELHE